MSREVVGGGDGLVQWSLVYIDILIIFVWSFECVYKYVCQFDSDNLEKGT